jgi:hypothetical protein
VTEWASAGCTTGVVGGVPIFESIRQKEIDRLVRKAIAHRWSNEIDVTRLETASDRRLQSWQQGEMGGENRPERTN